MDFVFEGSENCRLLSWVKLVEKQSIFQWIDVVYKCSTTKKGVTHIVNQNCLFQCRIESFLVDYCETTECNFKMKKLYILKLPGFTNTKMKLL